MMTPEKATNQLSVLNRINVIYGLVGLGLLSQISASGAWKSFMAGWAVAVLNFELLKRIGMGLLAVYEGGKLNPLFYFLLFGKFIFWGLVIALFTTTGWIQAIPFVMGTATLVVSGLGLGLGIARKELVHAR